MVRRGRTSPSQSLLNGLMAYSTVIDLTRAIQVPDGLDYATAATLGNAGWAAWLPLSWRAGM